MPSGVCLLGLRTSPIAILITGWSLSIRFGFGVSGTAHCIYLSALPPEGEGDARRNLPAVCRVGSGNPAGNLNAC